MEATLKTFEAVEKVNFAVYILFSMIHNVIAISIGAPSVIWITSLVMYSIIGVACDMIAGIMLGCCDGWEGDSPRYMDVIDATYHFIIANGIRSLSFIAMLIWVSSSGCCSIASDFGMVYMILTFAFPIAVVLEHLRYPMIRLYCMNMGHLHHIFACYRAGVSVDDCVRSGGLGDYRRHAFSGETLDAMGLPHALRMYVVLVQLGAQQGARAGARVGIVGAEMT